MAGELDRISEFVDNNRWVVPVGVGLTGILIYSILKPKGQGQTPPPGGGGGGGGTTPPPGGGGGGGGGGGTTPPPSGTGVLIDPGHGGSDAGTVYTLPVSPLPPFAPVILKEKDLTLYFANLVGYYLGQKGIDVNYTRTTDSSISVTNRASIACQKKPKVFVSIHFEQANSGTLGIYCSDESRILTSTVTNSTAEKVARGNRGIKQDCSGYGTIRLTKDCGFPSMVLVVSALNDWHFATGYIISFYEDRVSENTYNKRIAKGIADAIAEFAQ